MTNDVIDIENLTVYYGQVLALSNVTLKVKKQDFLGILGPNGGGKSTLLKAMLGLIKPTSGKIHILGLPPSEAGGLLGYVPQVSKFAKSFPINVLDTVLTGSLLKKRLLFRRYSLPEKKQAEKLLKWLGIQNLKSRQIGQLSGGQLQKVLIARALAQDPQILLLDEPTASLDSNSKTEVYSILHELNKKMTILLVTHDMTAVSSHVKNIACLNTELHYHGEPQLDSSTVAKTFGCPVDLIAHGVPHRVLHEHGKDNNYA